MSVPNRLVLASFSTGLETYEKPFLLNNDAFPVVQNALIWRKQIIKKPGTKKLGILMRALTTKSADNVTLSNPSPNSVNLITAMGFNVLEPNASIVPGNVVNISIAIGAQTLTNTDGSTTLTVGGAGVITAATINYGTGVINISFSAPAGPLTTTFTGAYYPHLPAMGIEPYDIDATANVPIDFPNNVYFDTRYAYTYNFSSTIFQDASFYRTTSAPITWSGQDYQQFFSCNYFGAMFVTNNKAGINILNGTYSSGSGTATVTFNFKSGGVNFTTLSVGDVLFFNEWTAGGATVNGVTGSVSDISGAGSGNYVVTFSGNQTVSSTGIVQLLTRMISGNGDGIKWYSTLGGTSGFSNFAPPLDNLSTSSTTYLTGARMVLPFGNRLLAIGTYESTSGGTQTYYGNRIRYCQLLPASPFYANSPTGSGAVANAWVSNIQGFGGYIDLDTADRIISATITQDSLILGLESDQRKMVTTGIETDPFTTQIINPDFGNVGTYATVPLDKGILSAGEYGFLLTTSFNSQRFDERIISQIFEVSTVSNGYDRISAARDFPNEVVYFSYRDVNSTGTYPNRTLVYNYRDPSFAIWNETYTTYGIFKDQDAEPWETLTKFTWETWNNTWESGVESNNYPFVAGGTPQGYIILKWDEDAENDPSIMIQSISGQTVTSPNHNLEAGMYVGFQDPTTPAPTIGYQVVSVTANTFTVDAPSLSSVIPGVWEVVILDNFFVQTKQFANTWEMARKIRIGTQRYFLDTTTTGEFTVALLGSQSPVPLNQPVPGQTLDQNPALISNSVVRTRPDDSLGLYDSQSQQTQIWHRLPTSILGDTVQIQMYLSDAQMRVVNIANAPWVLHAIVIDLYQSRVLA